MQHIPSLPWTLLLGVKSASFSLSRSSLVPCTPSGLSHTAVPAALPTSRNEFLSKSSSIRSLTQSLPACLCLMYPVVSALGVCASFRTWSSSDCTSDQSAGSWSFRRGFDLLRRELGSSRSRCPATSSTRFLAPSPTMVIDAELTVPCYDITKCIYFIGVMAT